ncbi:chaperonin [Campylobacter concisus]|uniref:DMT family transporter n=1 Tax=Campylobacter concisus TaxID=199 RepID=UPI001883A028|nr:SMR family transporter [Campylobacter concisus]MBE9835893.1 chaperonin [Campylobacter concisus]MBE9856743.1 chaperonin [Campylobacter concisus]
MSNRGFLWIFLGAVSECGWAYGLKHASNLSEFLLTTLLVSISFVSFMKALKYLPVSISYTVFVGFGTVFIVIAEIVSDYAASGIMPNFIRLFFIATLILGVLGLKGIKE